MIDTRDVAVFLGLDVGKGEHHATGMTPDGKQVIDKPLPNSEPKMRAKRPAAATAAPARRNPPGRRPSDTRWLTARCLRNRGS